MGQAGWPAPGQRQRRAAKFWQSVSRTYQPPGRTMSRESRSRHPGILSASWGSLERQAQPFFCLSPQGRVSRSGSRCYCCCCRRPRSCLQMSGSPCRVGGATPRPRGSLLPCPRPGPSPSSPAGPASPFSSRWLGGGRRLVSRWDGGFLKTPRNVALARGQRSTGFFAGKGQTGISCWLWEKGQPLSSPLTCSGSQLPGNASCGGLCGRKQRAPTKG